MKNTYLTFIQTFYVIIIIFLKICLCNGPKNLTFWLELLFHFCRDRIRTTVNVAGDSFGAGIVHYRSQDRLGALVDLKSQDLNKIDPDTEYYPEIQEYNTKL